MKEIESAIEFLFRRYMDNNQKLTLADFIEASEIEDNNFAELTKTQDEKDWYYFRSGTAAAGYLLYINIFKPLTMRQIINFTCIAMYAIVTYFTVQFIINSFSNADSLVSIVETLLTTLIILSVTLLAGYFCYKIVREKDTM